MGQIFSNLLNRLWGSKEVRILILGLDGKSSKIFNNV